ncbi:hypothetical protein FGLOB1_14850 [Fusarium globosum]|uniref:Uncharacterized protein n=1 Tax=Fusarium globosum TaxID=78864 RepID=A0A8H5U6L2_9HYPO|nr:hypothetical protein FGLOB1_14850 [Fusarium globosum]
MKVPEMKRQCAAAAIICDYENVYKGLDPEPGWHLWKVASEFAANSFYREDQERRGREKDIDVEDDAFMESYYSELMQTRDITVLEEGGEKITDSVEKHKLRTNMYGSVDVLCTSAGQLRIWQGIGKVAGILTPQQLKQPSKQPKVDIWPSTFEGTPFIFGAPVGG